MTTTYRSGLMLLAGIVLQASLPASPADPTTPPPPNVIFILSDDLGYGDLGSYGQEKVATPNLDQMAADGMRFTDFYSGAAVCAPARASLLTGLHTGHTSIRDLGHFAKRTEARGEIPLAPDPPSLGLIMKSAGYATACIGKWGLGSPGSSGDPNTQGFDFFYGYISHGEAHHYFPEYLWRNDRREPLPAGTYAPEPLLREMLGWLDAHHDRPFFLYWAPTQPHFLMEVPDLGAYADKPGWTRISKTRAAMIDRLDRDVGTLLAHLRELGVAENTVVLFSSDNGPSPERQVDVGFFNATGGLRGVKRDLYEGGIREPLIAWAPGRIQPGTTSTHLSAFCDVLPTLAEIAHLPVPAESTDGLSFLPELEGRESEQAIHDHLYWEQSQRGGKQAARAGRWKAVRLNVTRDAESPIELYDLDTDPAETTDVAAQHPDIVARMAAVLAREHTPSTIFPLLPAEREAAGLAATPLE